MKKKAITTQNNDNSEQLEINFDVVEKSVSFSYSKKEYKVICFNEKLVQIKKRDEQELIKYVLNNTKSF
jgi:hypothetical protein